jgi:DNA-binding transcriptional ArsR family regulator
MLKKLLISKVRVRILHEYMTDLKASFHVRGLVRHIDEEINAVRRELLNLESAGILKSKKDGNKVVYTVNKDCPILWELRSLFYKESTVGKQIYDIVKEIDGIQIVVLTESFITGKYENNTDVDFLFIGNMRVKDLSTAISQMEKEMERQIRFSAIKKEDFDFARKKKEPFLMNILEKDKIIMFGQLSDLL